MGFFDLFRGKGSAAAEPKTLPPPIVTPAPTSRRPEEVLVTAARLRELPTLRAAMESNKLPPSAPEALARELGISGTPIYFGDVLTESNNRLIHEAAFGHPGSRTWGEYETILLTDPCVQMGIEHNASQLRDAQVDVTPAPEAMMPDRKLAEAQADFVRWNLLEALEPGWPELIQQIVRGSLLNGFSLHERVPDRCEHPLLPNGKGYKLSKLAERLPKSIHPNGWFERDGELAAVQQQGPVNDVSALWVMPLLSAERLLLVTHNRSGNNYLGHSAFRSAWYLCKIREELAKLIGVTLQREGAGVPVAFCTDGNVDLSADQREKFEQLLANLVYHENASVVLPAGWDIKWVFSPGANKGHVVDAYNALGLVILQVVEAQQLALGVNGTGSRSVGEVHSASSDAFVLGIMASVAGVLNGVGARPYTGIAKQIVQWNWGPQPAYPKVSFTPKQAKLAPLDLANALKVARDGKLITVWTIDDENIFRAKVGYPKVTQEQWDNAEKQKQEAAAALAQQMKAGPGGPDDKGDGPPRPFPPKQAAVSDETVRALEALLVRYGSSTTSRAADFVPRRALRPAETFVAWGGIDSFLDTAKERFERGAKPLVVAALTRALPDVKAAMADGVIDHDELADVPLDLGALDAFVAKWMDEVRREGYRQAAGELQRASDARRTRTGASEEEDDFQPEAPAEAPSDQQRLTDAQRKQLMRRIEARLRSQLEDTAIDVERTGGDAAEVVSAVAADQVEAKSLQGDAGMVMTKAFNMGRDEFADEYADSIASVELSSLLDSATCGPCESMDGTEFDFGSDEYERNTPPLRQCDGGNRCRCIYVFNFK